MAMDSNPFRLAIGPPASRKGVLPRDSVAFVALPDEVWAIIDRDLGDTMGHGYSDTIRSIVLAWLSENGYLVKGGKGHAEDK